MTKGIRSKKIEKTEVSPSVIPITDLDKRGAPALTPMNFRVTEAFHREFKIYAVQHGMTMADLLHESFTALKTQSGR